MVVDIDKLRIFKNYLTKDNQTLIEWLDESIDYYGKIKISENSTFIVAEIEQSRRQF